MYFHLKIFLFDEFLIDLIYIELNVSLTIFASTKLKLKQFTVTVLFTNCSINFTQI